MKPKTVIEWNPIQSYQHGCDAGEFRRFAEQAAANGATHVLANQIRGSRWQLLDERDPHPDWASWPVWSKRLPGLFKFIVPPELEAWIPKDDAEANLAVLEERCAILREFGLKATMDGSEPMWWPEGAFRAHPEWRGPQVECMPLARLPYFSPCVDHPEVLDMYRRAMQELCRRAPEIDAYTMLTDDSAAGICWSKTYPGVNGPEHCRTRPLIDRIAGFLGSLQEGARAAGVELQVNLQNVFYPTDGIDYRRLGPNQYVHGRDRDGQAYGAGVSGNSWFSSHTFPAIGVPRVFTFAAQMQRAFASGASRVAVSFGTAEPDLLIQVYREFLASPTNGPGSRMDLLERVAAARYGRDNRETVLEIWQRIEEAIGNVRHACRGATLTLVGPLMMRWMTMPLVPRPEELTDEELAHCMRGRVAKNRDEAVAYHSRLGRGGWMNEPAVDHVRLTIVEACGALKAAAGLARTLAARGGDGAGELALLAQRVEVFECLLVNAQNTIEYSTLLAVRGRREMEVTWRDAYGTGGINRGGYELRSIARAELDNTLRLAALVENASGPVLAMVGNPADEDSLSLSPELPAQLRRKAEIMLNHWPEYNELYPPLPAVEPESRIADARPSSPPETQC